MLGTEKCYRGYTCARFPTMAGQGHGQWELPLYMQRVLSSIETLHSYENNSSAPGLILGMSSANERHRHSVTSFLIGWAYT